MHAVVLLCVKRFFVFFKLYKVTQFLHNVELFAAAVC